MNQNNFLTLKYKLIFKNIYYFTCKNSKKKVALKYFLRNYFFFKLINFFKRNGYNKNLILKIFLNNYYYYWNLFLQFNDIKYYYILIKKILIKYNFIIYSNDNHLITYSNIITPTHFLNLNDLKYTSYNSYNFLNIKFFEKNCKIESFSSKYIYNINNSFSIYFLRVQRRYNKRRYSKVRVSSRAPFFTGICLSSLFLANLWNGSIKSVDWFTAWIILIDIDVVLLLFFCYYIFRLLTLKNLTIFIRQRGKIKVINLLNILLLNKILKYILNNENK